MDYLNNTIKYLEEQNKELKDKLKRMTDLNQIITRQRESEQRDYLQRFHQEEINVIRQIAENNEKSLRNQIKKLNQQILQLNTNVQGGLDMIVSLRKEIKQLENNKDSLIAQANDLRIQVLQTQAQLTRDRQQFTKHYQRLQHQYKSRQSEVISKYMSKLEQSSDRHEDEMRKKTKFIDFLQNKLNSLQKEKQLLSEEINKLIATLSSEQQRISTKNKVNHNELNQYKKQNSNLKVYIKNLQIQLVQLESQKNNQQNKALQVEKQLSGLKAKQKEIQRSKNKQIERQKYKNKSINQDLSFQKKYLKEQIQKQRRKEKDFNNSTKILIGKIKQIENKYEQEKSISSIFDKTATKTVKKSLQTFQSISLDNSFSRDTPSISCFLKNDKCEAKFSLSKKDLKIQTRGSQMNLLKLKDLDTPCFQNSKAKNIKRTIKIRK